MKKIKLFLSLLMVMIVSVGNVWAAEGDTHDFSQTLQQLLNKNASIAGIDIDAQSYPVKEVIISYRYNKSIENAVTMAVSVGGNSWGTQYSEETGSNYSTRSFTGSSTTGAISISFTNNTGNGTGHGTFYVNNIQLVEGASAGPAKPTVSIDPEELTFTIVGVGDPAPAAQSFTITGSNMTAALSIADLTKFDYSVTSGSLSPSEGSISATVTVTPKSGFTTNAGVKNETLTISGDDLDDDIELALNAEVKAKHDIIFDTDLKSIVKVSVMEGETYDITETIEAALIASCTYTKFEGWTTATIIDDPSVKPSLVSSVTMSTTDVTLKPVFSVTTGGGGSSEKTAHLTESEMRTQLNSSATAYSTATETSYDDTSDGVEWAGKFSANAGGYWVQLRQNATPAYLKISADGNISEVKVTVTSANNKSGGQYNMTSGYNNFTSSVNLYLSTENVAGSENANVVATAATGTGISYIELTLTPSSADNSELYLISSGGCRVWLVDVTYSTGGGGTTTYSLDPGCAAAGQCYAPTFNPAAGTFDAAQNVELTCATEEATIRYTIDGSAPSKTVGTVYSSAIAISANTTIKAIAYKDGMEDSEIAEGVFNIRCAQPTFSPAGGDYDEAQNVTISADGADHIYYTLNGNDPVPSEEGTSEYTAAISINTTGSHTIKAIAVKDGYANSNVASATYVMDLPYANIEAFIAAKPATAKSLTLNNAIITGVDGTTLYVQDETAGIMIYGLASLPENAAPNHSISGTIVGKYSLFKHQHELVKPNNTTPIDISNVTISADEVARPAISEYTSLSAAYAAKPMMLVKLTDVRYDGTQYEFSGNKIYNTFGALTDKTMPETTVDCDITGVVIDYNGTLELLPVFATDIVADADAADPTVSPSGGADAENAVTAAAVEITAAADTKVDGLASKTVDISSTTPTEVTVTVTRDFYRSVNFSCGWYKAAAAKYDINGQGAKTEGTVVAKVAGVEAATAAEGDEVHVFITPEAHFHLATILVNGAAPTEVVEGTEYSFTMPDEAVTIAVTWTEDEKYTLTFTAGGGSGDAPAISGNTYYEGDVIQLPANTFTYDATHKFTKWLIGGTEYAAGVNYTMPAATTEAVAQWKEIPNFASGDWILVKDADELTEGSYVIIASLADNVAMKSFNTTSSDNNCKGKSGADKNGDLLTYDSDYGVFEIVAGNKTNTIAFFDVANENYLYAASSGSNHMKAEATLSDNSSWMVSVTGLGAATPTAQGTNTRNEMRYNPNSGSPIFSCYASTATTGSAVAFYKYHVPSLKLTYNKNTTDEVTNMPAMQIADNENKVTVSSEVPLRAGYLFDGWKDAEENVYEAGEEYPLTADLTLYAQWQMATAHSLSYDKNGGEGDVDVDTEYYPNDVVTLAGALTKEGYIFAGWEYDGNVYAAGAQFTMPNEDVVMTAKFAQGAVYTIISKELVSTQGAPEGSNATFVNTYNNDKCQLTNGKSMTLTLSGYDLYTIKALTLRMKSNASSGEGTLSVTIGGNAVSFTTNKWYDGDYHSSSYEDIQVTLNPNRVMPDEDVVIKIEASQNSLYCQSFAVEYERVLDEIRTAGIASGVWGTICPKKEVKYPAGASFFQISYVEYHSGVPYKVFYDEIAEGASLEAGHPYLFQADEEATAIKGIAVGDDATVAIDDHGFKGVLENETISVVSADVDAYRYYIVYNNEIRLCGEGQFLIRAERAYLDMSDPYVEKQYKAPINGRRRVALTNNAPQVATGIDALNASDAPAKVLINGQLFIIRGEKMYDAKGQLVK